MAEEPLGGDVLLFLNLDGVLRRRDAPLYRLEEDRDHYPASCELLMIDPGCGFDREAARELLQTCRRLF